MSERIYLITETKSGTQQLVRANTASQALHHVVQGVFQVKAATAIQVSELMGQGVVPESASNKRADQFEIEA